MGRSVSSCTYKIVFFSILSCLDLFGEKTRNSRAWKMTKFPFMMYMAVNSSFSRDLDFEYKYWYSLFFHGNKYILKAFLFFRGLVMAACFFTANVSSIC